MNAQLKSLGSTPQATAAARRLAAYETFFQAFWYAPADGAGVRKLGFKGTAAQFTITVRDATLGRPIACFTSTLVGGKVTVDLTSLTNNNQSIVLYLFGTSADANQFAKDIAAGWTPADLQILAALNLLHMVPDVSFVPQLQVRAAREACDPQDPASVELMNAELDLIYAGFAEFDGQVLPDVRDGLKGSLIAAPGNPPEWIPP